MCCLQSVVDSNIVEVSEDKTLVRCKSEPDKWPLVNFPIGSSTLNAEVPEFVPGQKYAAPAKESNKAENGSKRSQGASSHDYTKYMLPVLSSSAPEHVAEWTQVTARYRDKRLKKVPPAIKKVNSGVDVAIS